MGLSILLQSEINMYEAYDDGYFNNFLNGFGRDFSSTYGGYPGYGMPPTQFGYPFRASQLGYY
jgi:hypothetical protein